MKKILWAFVLIVVLGGSFVPVNANPGGGDPGPICNPLTDPNCKPPIPPAA